VHAVIFAFAFVYDVFEFDFGIFLEQYDCSVGIVYFSFFYHIVILYSIFIPIVLDIDPKLILISQHLYYFDLMLVFCYVLLHYFEIGILLELLLCI